jgi:FAD/FMN-containing dehydrogenase
MSTNKIRNWDGTQTWEPEAIYRPKDEEQVAEVIRRTLEDRKRLKIIGSALSWSDAIDVPETAMQLDQMNKVLEVNRDKRQVRLEAGALLEHINQELSDNTLAFENFGSIVQQTAGGYIATGSHGTGAKTQILSTYIESMRLVDGLGQLHVLDANHEPDLFSAARVNLGCLGVVTELTFRCVEAFDLEERLELIDFDTALADLDAYIKDNDYLKLWWFPYTDKIQVYAFNKTDKPRSTAGFPEFLDRSGISSVVFTLLLGMTRGIPGSTPFILNTLQKIHYHPHSRVNRSDKIVTVSSSIPNHQETEYSIPIEQAAKAIDETRRFILKANYRVNFPLEVRFVAADDIPMSPAYGRDSCFIGPYISALKWAPDLFADFEAMIGDYEGRPHWGKSFSRTGEQLRALYPVYDAFNELRKECDPHGLFRNSFVERVFPDG